MTSPNGQSQSTSMAVQAPAPMAVVETASSAVAAREKAAVEARYLVAISRPRNADAARVRLLQRAKSPMFASVAEYSKPVGGGKTAKGASIRMMEEIARQWGNIDVQSPVVFDDHERRIVRVTVTDLESNYAASVDIILEKTVERRSPRSGDQVLGSRVNSQGQTVYRIAADEDAFLVKQNAAISKARRECIRAVVPGDLVEEAMQQCADTRRQEVKEDPAGARKRISDAFFSIGIMPQQLCDYLDKPSLEAVTEAELELLRSIYTAMKEGETTWKEVMAEKAPEKTDAPATTAKGTEGLKSRLGAKKNGGTEEPRTAASAHPHAPAADPDEAAELERQRVMDEGVSPESLQKQLDKDAEGLPFA